MDGGRGAGGDGAGDEKEGARLGASDTLTSMNNLAPTLRSLGLTQDTIAMMTGAGISNCKARSQPSSYTKSQLILRNRNKVLCNPFRLQRLHG